jgi:hypothetical protein
MTATGCDVARTTGSVDEILEASPEIPNVGSYTGRRLSRVSCVSCGHLGSRFFVLLRLIVMPLDGEEHARPQDENLERKDDYRE